MLRYSWILALVVTGACGGECTLRPCLHGLLLSLDGEPDSTTMVSVTPAGGLTQVVDCATAYCGPDMHFPDVMTDSVTVTVRSQGVEATDVLTLTYGRAEPNGPGCGSCLQAQATVPLP